MHQPAPRPTPQATGRSAGRGIRLAGTALMVMACLLAATQTRAASAEHEAAAAQLLRLLRVDAGVEPIARRLRESTLARMRQGSVPAELHVEAEPYLQRIGGIIEDGLAWSALEPAFVDTYTRTFTEAELRAQVDFFGSPAGQAYLNNIGTLNAAAADLVRRRALELAPLMQAVTSEMNTALGIDDASAP